MLRSCLQRYVTYYSTDLLWTLLLVASFKLAKRRIHQIKPVKKESSSEKNQNNVHNIFKTICFKFLCL